MVKKLNKVQILDMIPEGWHQITLDTYLNKILQLKVSNSEDPVDIMDTNIKLASIFLGFDSEIVEQFPMTFIKSINEKLSFLSEKPKPSSSRYEWIKTIEDPTYDDFITFVKVSEQIDKADFSNFPLIIKIVLRSKLTQEEIMQMPMDEVEYGFFLLRRSLLSYLRSTMKDLKVQAIAMKTNEMLDKMKTVEGMSFKKKLKHLRESYKELTAGIGYVKK